jgi:hypothetical protein
MSSAFLFSLQSVVKIEIQILNLVFSTEVDFVGIYSKIGFCWEAH